MRSDLPRVTQLLAQVILPSRLSSFGPFCPFTRFY